MGFSVWLVICLLEQLYFTGCLLSLSWQIFLHWDFEACCECSLFFVGTSGYGVQSGRTPLWGGAGRNGATLALWASGIEVGEPPVCSWDAWRNPFSLAFLFFNPRVREVQPICSATSWPLRVQGDTGQLGKANFKSHPPSTQIFICTQWSTGLSWPGSSQYLRYLILAPKLSEAGLQVKRRDSTAVFKS